jgi:hypothetical protein
MDLRERIREAINCVSAENKSNTPDFILARFLTDCLGAFDRATVARTKYYSAPQTTTENSTSVPDEVRRQPSPEAGCPPSDLISRLQQHADHVAGDGPSGAAYDPETLDLEHNAADMIERLATAEGQRSAVTGSHEEFLLAVEHVKGGEGRRTWSCSDGWAVTTPKRLVELEIAEETLTHIGDELRRIDETSALPDGDGVSTSLALWAKEWAERIKSVRTH